MKKGFWLFILLACLMTPRLVVAADAPAVVDVPPPAPAPLDVVTLKDGGVLYGEVIEMSGGVLLIKTAAAADNIVKINWDHTVAFRALSRHLNSSRYLLSLVVR